MHLSNAMSYTACRRMKRVECRLLILTPIYPQAVKTLLLAGRSSGSLLPRRLPDFRSVAVIAANNQPLRLELTAAGTAQVFHLFPF